LAPTLVGFATAVGVFSTHFRSPHPIFTVFGHDGQLQFQGCNSSSRALHLPSPSPSSHRVALHRPHAQTSLKNSLTFNNVKSEMPPAEHLATECHQFAVQREMLVIF